MSVGAQQELHCFIMLITSFTSSICAAYQF